MIGRKCFPDWKSGLGEHIETRQETGRKFQILRCPKPHWWPTADSVWVINEVLNYKGQQLQLKMSFLEPELTEESISDELDFSAPSVLSWVSEMGSPARSLLRRNTRVDCSLSGTVFAFFLGGIADFHALEKPKQIQYKFTDLLSSSTTATLLSVTLSLIGFCLCWGLTTRQPLWVILCHLLVKGRRKIEKIVEEMKERDRGERKMNDSEETEEITRGPRATVRSPEWHSHCRHADVMQHFSNPIIATNENIIIWAVLSFEEEYMGLKVNGAWSFE